MRRQRCVGMALWLAACGSPAPDTEGPSDAQVGPPLTLDAGPAVAGTSLTVTARGAAPGASMWLVIGLGGPGDGPCPPALGGGCLDALEPLRLVGPRRADATGRVVWTVPIPAGAPSGPVALQAAVVGPAPAPLTPAIARHVHPAGTVVAPGVDSDSDGAAWGAGDCDEADPGRYAGAYDPVGDGVDADCDFADGAAGDVDGDGWGLGADCGEGDPAVYPGAAERCDGLDQGCDGAVDEGVPTDGAGCHDPGPPTFPSTVDVVHVTVRTDDIAGSGTDDLDVSLCLTATDCVRLDHATWDERDADGLETFTVEGAALDRSRIDRVELRVASGVDDWRPACVQVTLDGEPAHCEDAGLPLLGPGLMSWSDPLGLHAACQTCDRATLTHGPFLGAPRVDGGRLWLRTDATRRVEVRVAPDAAGLATASPIAVRYPDAARDFTDVVEVSGLPGDVDWRYRVSVDGAPPVDGTLPAMPPPGHLRLALGSCARESLQPVFNHVVAADPDAFLFLGDSHYGNTPDLDELRQWWRWAHGRTERAAMMSVVPSIATWDDHDFVGNDATGLTPGREPALRVFTEYWANQAFGVPGTPGVFQRLRMGDVDVFMLDGRYHRAIEGDMLGSAQLAWLQAGLLASDAVFKLIAVGSQWTLEGDSDSWAAYPDAQRSFTAWLASAGVEGVVLLSGDMHRGELRLVPGGPDGYTLPEVTASGLAQVLRPCPSSNGLVGCFADRRQFALLDVDTTLPDPTLTARIVDDLGVERATWTILRSSLVGRPRAPVHRGADFNGDGYADLAIGVPGEGHVANTAAGTVQVLRPCPSSNGLVGCFADRRQFALLDVDTTLPDPTLTARIVDDLGVERASWTILRSSLVGRPRAPVHRGADFNGDGYADLAIGVPGEGHVANTAAGTVQVLYGGTEGLQAANAHGFDQDDAGFPGNNEVDDQLGAALSTGDYDGDGRSDLLIGLPWEDMAASVDAGHAVLARGGATRLGGPFGDLGEGMGGVGGVTVQDDRFAASIASGDFDADGFTDAAFGIPGDSGHGRVVVLYGGLGGLGGARHAFLDQGAHGGLDEAGDAFGAALAAGDLNGDGFDDLAIGAPGEDAGAGSVQVRLGGPVGLDATATAWTQPGPEVAEAGDRFGAAVHIADLDGDGRAELIAAAPDETLFSGALAGAVSVWFGGAAGPDASRSLLISTEAFGVATTSGDHAGSAISAGDLDGDGFGDLAVGLPGRTVGGAAGAGAVWVLYGGPSGPTAGAAVMVDEGPHPSADAEADDAFGSALSSADFDADGYDDLAVGAPGEDLATAFGAGEVLVLPGGPSGVSAADGWLWSQLRFGVDAAPAESSDRFGATLSGG